MAKIYNPEAGYFVKGDRKIKGSKPDVHITDLNQLTVKDWAEEYQLFISPTKSVESNIVFGEYKRAVLQYFMKNPQSTIHDVRKNVGIMITADGREAITNSKFGQDVRRASRDIQQTYRVTDSEGKPVKPKQWEAKFQVPGQKKFLKELQEILDNHFGREWMPPEILEQVKFEGHHVKGVASLNKFFEGAGPEEFLELQQTLINKGFTAGSSHGNFAWLSPEQHNLVHKLQSEAVPDPKNPGKFLSGYDFEKASGNKGIVSYGDTEFARSKEISDKIDAAPFKRPKWQDDKLAAGVDPKGIDNFKLTRKDFLNEWIDLTGDEFNKSVETAIRAAPVKGLDPELQILANRKLANKQIELNAQAVLARSSRKLAFSKAATGLGRTESLLRIAAGDYIGGTVGLAMQSKPFQQKVMEEIFKRTGKAAAKLAPGVGITMGTLEAAGYASQGRFTQSAIAAFGAAAGEIPGVGDLVQGGTDLLNTGIDVATGNFLPDSNLDDEYLDRQKQLTRRLRVFKRP